MLPKVRFRPCLFLDGLRFLVVRQQSRGEEERLLTRLNGHVGFSGLGLNEPPRDFELILTIVTPDAEGLRLIASCPWLIPRTGEVALDFLVEDEYDARILHRFFDRQHVQGWHNTETFHHLTTTYTGPPHRPGRIFSAYSDHPSKFDIESNCCHIEARYQGIVALRRIGIHAAADWLLFDHFAFWKKHLRFYEIDLTRLGRWYDNQRSGKRRHRPLRHLSGKNWYNVDCATGSVLFRNFGRHSSEPEITIQHFVDHFGRGPFLRSIDPTLFLPNAEDIMLMTIRSEDFVA